MNKAKFLEIGEIVEQLSGLMIVLMTCMEKGDLEPGAFVPTLEIALNMTNRISEGLEAL